MSKENAMATHHDQSNSVGDCTSVVAAATLTLRFCTKKH